MDGTYDVTTLTWARQNVTSKLKVKTHLSTVGVNVRCYTTIPTGQGQIWMSILQGERYWCGSHWFCYIN